MCVIRLLICFGTIALTTPALSAQFLIVQGPGSNRCTIVEQTNSGSVVVFGDGASGDRPPTDSVPAIVGDGAYGDVPTAETDMRKIATCAGGRQQATALTTSGPFFIVQGDQSNRCTITGQLPAEGYGTMVGDGAYGDRASAEADMKTMAACAGPARQ